MATIDEILGNNNTRQDNGRIAQQNVEPPVNNGSAVVQPPQPKVQDTDKPVNDGSVVASVEQPSVQNTSTDSAQSKRIGYVEMFKQMEPYRTPTPEEVEKQRKRQKRDEIFAAIGDGISALSNLYFTSKGAPNAYNPQNSMSAKTRERWEKIRNEREANRARYMNGYMKAMQADDEANRDSRNWKYKLGRDGVEDKRYNDNIEHRNEREGVLDARAKEEAEIRKRQFEENKRQFDTSSGQNQQRINLESKRISYQKKEDKVQFYLGKGKGVVDVPKGAINAHNISSIFSKLPEEVRNSVRGEAIYDSKKKKVVGYKAPTMQDMLNAIGDNIENSPEAQDALREIAGQQVKTSKKKSPTL